MPTIYVRVREVSGVAKLYTACATAKLLAQLAGHTTITPDDLRTIKALGYTVKEAARLDAEHFAR